MAKPLSRKPHLSGEIRLEHYDPDGDSYVVFMEPRRYEQEEVDRLRFSSEISWNTEEQGRVSQKDRVPWSTLESRMVCLCLVGCNIPDEDTEKLLFSPGTSCREPGKPLSKAVENRFNTTWYNLPGELAEEIYEKLAAFYPPFDWRSGEGEE